MAIAIKENAKNTIRFTATMLAPVGSSRANEQIMPITKHTTDITAEQIATDLKLLQRRMELSAGNIIRLEISRAPIMRIPRTTVTAVSTAITVL